MKFNVTQKNVSYKVSNRPVAVMLIGRVGSGKSYFAKNYLKNLIDKDFQYLSTDSIIEEIANLQNKKYEDIFVDTIDLASKMFFDKLKDNINNKNSFVIDRTNGSVFKRKEILNSIPSDFDKIAIWVNTNLDQNKEQLQKRNLDHSEKTIPEDLLHKLKIFPPQLSEGFDNIYEVKYVK